MYNSEFNISIFMILKHGTKEGVKRVWWKNGLFMKGTGLSNKSTVLMSEQQHCNG